MIELKHQLKLIFAMIVVGTIGLVVHYVNLSSAAIAFSRAFIGSVFIFIWIKVSGTKFDFKIIREKQWLLLGTGVAMGFNWIFLFEAYRYTTVSVATLCYYMAPVMMIAVSPILFNEKLTHHQLFLTLVALLGVILISGGVDASGNQSFKGIIFGLTAALFYASIMLMNKMMRVVNVMIRTFIQLAIATIIMFIYVICTTGFTLELLVPKTFLLLLLIGMLHTGFVYVLLFSSFDHLSLQTASLLTYIDPVIAIIVSYLFLNQHMTFIQMMGTLMILGSTIINEYLNNNKIVTKK